MQYSTVTGQPVYDQNLDWIFSENWKYDHIGIFDFSKCGDLNLCIFWYSISQKFQTSKIQSTQVNLTTFSGV